LGIDSDSDFVWTRSSWYFQSVPFNPPASMPATSQGATWASTVSATFEIALRDMRSGRLFHDDPFINPAVFSGMQGVDAPGSVLEQENDPLILGFAANDTSIGHVPHPWLEPIILKASTLFEISVRNRSAGAAAFTVHLINADGTTRDTAQKTLPAKEQTSFVVTDPTVFPNANFDAATLFTGSIAVCSTQPLGLVTIGIEGGALYTISVTNDLCP